MKTKILLSLALVGLTSATAGMGMFAYFTSTAMSTDNVFGAGNIELLAGGFQSSGAFMSADNVKPGDSISGSILLQNAGSLVGDAFDLDISLDVSQNQMYMMSSYMRITQLDYDGVSQLALVQDANGNGFADLADFDVSNAALADLSDPGAIGKTLELTVVFDTSAGNDLQGESMTAQWTFFLAQVGAVDLVG